MATSWRTCPRCRFLLDVDATICRFCGAAVDAPAAPPGPAFRPLTAPPAASRQPAGGRWFNRAVGVGVAVALLAGAIGFAVLRPGRNFPSEWDPRLADLAAFVERERDLGFKHPVAVDFLTAGEYSERTRTAEDDVTDELRESLEQDEAVFRAFGLLAGDGDLFESSNDLRDTGTLAFYDLREERIVVRGTDMSVDLKVTLVHELTHVLQDQHFGVQDLVDAETSGARFAARALIEGDAERIEDRYVESLLPAEAEEYVAGQPSDVDEAGLGDVPTSLLALFGAPYQLGYPFVLTLEVDGGDRAVDDAFRSPPTSEEHLLDPVAYLTGDDPEPLPELDAPDGEAIDQGDFGSLTLLLLLAERIDSRQALEAVDGWHGDAYVTYERDDRVCVQAEFTVDSAGDLTELDRALTAWAGVMPEGAATVVASDEGVELTTCDPGEDTAAALTGTGGAALGIAQARSFMVAAALRSGADVEQARCVGQRVVDGLTNGQIEGSEEIPDDAIPTLLDASFTACVT